MLMFKNYISYPKSHKINLFKTRYLQWSWVKMNKCFYVVAYPLPGYENSPLGCRYATGLPLTYGMFGLMFFLQFRYYSEF